MAAQDEAVYIISVAAELVGMHPQTLRIYERKGLIEPYRTPGGTRRYSDADLERLAAIQELTDEGVSLEGVRRILVLRQENERLRYQLRRLRRIIEDVQAEIAAGNDAIAVASRRRHLPDIPRS
jgi:MerR family transcriptional regulator, heat shock protein HspR